MWINSYMKGQFSLAGFYTADNCRGPVTIPVIVNSNIICVVKNA